MFQLPRKFNKTYSTENIMIISVSVVYTMVLLPHILSTACREIFLSPGWVACLPYTLLWWTAPQPG